MAGRARSDAPGGLVLIAFAVLFAGFVAVERTLLPRTRGRIAAEALPA